MKRKRKNHSEQREAKRPKRDAVSTDPPTWLLLRQYYAQVVTLRQYLASRLSSKRRKKVLQYGLDLSNATERGSDPSVAALLDNIVVGSFKHVESSSIDLFDKDLTVFTQQLSNSTAATNQTQVVLNQSDVGRHSYVPALFSPLFSEF